jgi:hypothetical protein
MKRVREEDGPNPTKDEGISPPHAPNQFGDWLITNIYKYANVRDSDELAQLKAEHAAVKTHRDELLQVFREVIVDDNFKEYSWFCFVCGDTRVMEERTVCGRCQDAYVPCDKCPVSLCRSETHPVCHVCAEQQYEDEFICDGYADVFCTL